MKQGIQSWFQEQEGKRLRAEENYNRSPISYKQGTVASLTVCVLVVRPITSKQQCHVVDNPCESLWARHELPSLDCCAPPALRLPRSLEFLLQCVWKSLDHS